MRHQSASKVAPSVQTTQIAETDGSVNTSQFRAIDQSARSACMKSCAVRIPESVGPDGFQNLIDCKDIDAIVP